MSRSPEPALVFVTKAAQLPTLYHTYRVCGQLSAQVWRRFEVPSITWRYGVEYRPETASLAWLPRAFSYGETRVEWCDLTNAYRARRYLGAYLVWPDHVGEAPEVTRPTRTLHRLPFGRGGKSVETLTLGDTGWVELTLKPREVRASRALVPGLRVCRGVEEFTNYFAPGECVWKYEFYRGEAVLTKHDFLGLTRAGRVAMYRYSPFAPHKPLVCELAPEHFAGWVVQDSGPRTWPTPRVPLAHVLSGVWSL